MPEKVFLSYNRADGPAVQRIADKLTEAGITCWLDEWDLVPGLPWQREIEKALGESGTCAVFIGPGGLGPWQDEEMRVAVDRRVMDAGFRVIPVLLPGAERGRRCAVPPFLANVTWVEFRHSLDEAAGLHRLLCGIRRVPPGRRRAIEADTPCPYRGLRTFDIADAAYFFGREALTDWLVSDVRRLLGGSGEPRFLAIVGASGSGKSSVARAGLLDALRQDAIEGSAGWPTIIVGHPGPDPILELFSRGRAVLGLPDNAIQLEEAFIDPIRSEPRHRNKLHMQASLALANQPGTPCLLVFVDQFEEIFTACQDQTLRQRFVELLLHAAREPGGRVLVVITIRADFIGACGEIPELAAAVSGGMELVGPMSEPELRSAIVQPAVLAGAGFQPGLVETLIRDVTAQPGGLPLLEFVLEQLWESRNGGEIAAEAYADIGGIEGALARRADEILKDCGSAGEQQHVLALLTRLVHVADTADGGADTRQRCEMGAADYARLKPFVDARLLVASGNPAAGGPRTLEVAHEALIRHWPTLRAALKDRREFLAFRQSIHREFEAWQRLKDQAGRKNERRECLLEGRDLKLALDWLKKRPAEFGEEERAFVRASSRLAAGKRLWAWLPAGAAALVAVAAMAFGLWIGSEGISARAGFYVLLGKVHVTVLEPDMIQVVSDDALKQAGGRIGFRMGSPDDDPEAEKSEKPAHQVYFAKPFSIGKYEITFDEYDVFVRLVEADGGCPNDSMHKIEVPSDEGWGRGRRPVINVSWDDAVCYAAWLSQRTGKSYRLPTEAEWEYAARGGTQSLYWWGNEAGKGRANCSDCGSQWGGMKTAPVGSFPANPYGLHDTAGNVEEWIQDCSHDDYGKAPADGSAWLQADQGFCGGRVIRGGSWYLDTTNLRSASRVGYSPLYRFFNLGFRLAQD